MMTWRALLPVTCLLNCGAAIATHDWHSAVGWLLATVYSTAVL